MTRSDFLKVVNIVFGIGESPEHHITMDYSTHIKWITLYVHKHGADSISTGVVDTIDVESLDEEAMAWLERWTETIRKERDLNGTH